jgi:SsrA-binding protein
VAKPKREAAPPERDGDRDVARNRRATFDYEIEERFEAGLALQGSEVKALRDRSADLSDAWCLIEGGEAFVRGLNIPVLPGCSCPHQPKRSRKLLLHAREIETLQRGIEREGMTAVALRIYFRNGRAKLELGLARGKRKIDKRQALKEREADRDAQAAMAGRGARRA